MTAQSVTPQRLPVDFASLPAVEEIRGVNPQELGRHPVLSSDRPAVLRGLVQHWPEIGMSSDALLDDMSSRASEQPLLFFTLRPGGGGRFFYDDSLLGFNFERRQGRLQDCCRWLQRNGARSDAGTLYVGSTAVDGWLPDFRHRHPLGLERDHALCSLWLGNRTRIAAHYDVDRNLACVVAGRRRFTLFPPDQMMNLYIGPLERTPAGQPISLVDFHAVDESRFPRFTRALESAAVAELEPGDALYLPRMWWHHVEALSDINLLINYWWRDSAEYLGSAQSALLHAAVAIGQLGEDERESWRELFERVVFTRDEADWSHLPASARGVLGELDEAQVRALRQYIARQLQP